VKPRGKDDFDDSTNKLLPAYSGNRVTPLASHKIKPVVGHAVISSEIYAWSDEAAGRIFSLKILMPQITGLLLMIYAIFKVFS